MSGSFCLIYVSLIISIVVSDVRCQSDDTSNSRQRPVVPGKSDVATPKADDTRARLKGLCRDGWSKGTMKDFAGKQIPICLKINPEAQTWSEAQASCRKDYGFLMKFDSGARLDEQDLLKSVIFNGITKFWTGMHSENGHLIWDDLIPNQVRPHNRLNDTSVPVQPWTWESTIPQRRQQYCGQMSIHTDDDKHRRKRSSDDDSVDFSSFDLSKFGSSVFNDNFRRSNNDFPRTSPFQTMLTRTQMSDQLDLPGTLGLQSERQIPGSGLPDANIQNGGLATTDMPSFESNGNFDPTDSESVTPFVTGEGFNSESNEMSVTSPEGLVDTVKEVAANLESNLGDFPIPSPTEAAETLRNLIKENAENLKPDNTDSILSDMADSFSTITTVAPPAGSDNVNINVFDDLNIGKTDDTPTIETPTVDIPVIDTPNDESTVIDTPIIDNIPGLNTDDSNAGLSILDTVNSVINDNSDGTSVFGSTDVKDDSLSDTMDALIDNAGKDLIGNGMTNSVNEVLDVLSDTDTKSTDDTVLGNNADMLDNIPNVLNPTVDDVKSDDSLGYGQLTDIITNDAIKEAMDIDTLPDKTKDIVSDIFPDTETDSNTNIDELNSDTIIPETENFDTTDDFNKNAADQILENFDDKIADDVIQTEDVHDYLNKATSSSGDLDDVPDSIAQKIPDSSSLDDTLDAENLDLNDKLPEMEDSLSGISEVTDTHDDTDDITDSLNGERNVEDSVSDILDKMELSESDNDPGIMVSSDQIDEVKDLLDDQITAENDLLDTPDNSNDGKEDSVQETDGITGDGIDDNTEIMSEKLDDMETGDVKDQKNTDYFKDMAERIGLSSGTSHDDIMDDQDISHVTDDISEIDIDTGNENFESNDDTSDFKSDGNVDSQSKRDSDGSEDDWNENIRDVRTGFPSANSDDFENGGVGESKTEFDEDRYKSKEEYDRSKGLSDFYDDTENDNDKKFEQESIDFGDDSPRLQPETDDETTEKYSDDVDDKSKAENDWETSTEIPDSYFEDKEEGDRFEDIPNLAEDVVESDKKIPLIPEIESKDMQLSSCDVKMPSVCFGYEVEVMERASTCENGWYGHVLLDTCYQILENRMNYRDSVSTCKARSARLVFASSQFERQFVLLAVHKEGRLFRGAKFWMESQYDKANCKFFDERGVGTMKSCNERLNAVCVRDALPLPVYNADNKPLYGTDPARYYDTAGEQRTFVSSRTDNKLPCKLTSAASEFPVLWFKDGVLVETKDKYVSTDISLYLNDDLVSSISMVTDRDLATPVLQGEYWCEVWDRQILARQRSRSYNVRFSDVISFHGSMELPAFSQKDELLFNMANRKFPELSAAEMDIKKVFEDVLPTVQTTLRDVIDVFTYIDGIRSNPNVIEYHTYFTMNREYMSVDEEILYNRLKAILRTKLGNRFYMASLPGGTSLSTFRTMSLQSTVSCPAASLQTTRDLYGHTIPVKIFSFPKAAVGEYANSVDNCSITNQLPSGSARCLGDFYTGAYWGDVVANECIEEADLDNFNNQIWGVSAYTDKLTEMSQVIVDARNVEKLVSEVAQIAKVAPKFTPTDINKIADVLDHTTQVRDLPQQVGEDVLRTVDRLMTMSETESHVANVETKAANRIIKSIERYAENADIGTKDHVRHVSDNVVVEIWNIKPSTKPVIGLAAETRGTSLDKPFKMESIATVYNTSQLYEANVDAAIELPDEVFAMKDKGGKVSSRLTMMVFRKNKLFKAAITDGGRKMNPTEQQLSNLNSYVISASIAGRKLQDLTEKVKTIFKPIKNVESSRTCVWWDFDMNNFKGGWSNQGCVYDGKVNGRDVCLCDHLTNFAVLIDFYGQAKPIPDHHELSLSIITMLGLSCSILGLSLTIISYLFFRKLRQGRAQQTLFNLSLSLLLSMLVFLVGIKQTHNYYGCITVAILLHYLILVSFMWMLMEAILQYLTFVKILGTYITRFTLKTVLPAWGLPLIPVIVILSIDYTLYKGGPNYCWMDLPAFYYGFAIPVTCIIVINIVIFVVTIVSIFRRGKGLRSNQKKQKMAMTNLQAAITSFILLGLTWIFGYLAISDARLPFQYVFTILNSLQGFFIFILFVVRKKKVREQWYFICCKGVEKDRVSRSLSASNSIPSTYSNGSNRNSRKDGRERDRSDSTKTVQSTYSNSSTGFTNYGYDHGYDFPFNRYEKRAFRKF